MEIIKTPSATISSGEHCSFLVGAFMRIASRSAFLKFRWVRLNIDVASYLCAFDNESVPLLYMSCVCWERDRSFLSSKSLVRKLYFASIPFSEQTSLSLLCFPLPSLPVSTCFFFFFFFFFLIFFFFFFLF